jgi:signal transduction histidine kinase/DNA-binding NarL/FixJ family response regulator
MSARKSVILYAEDEPFIRDELVEILKMRYHEVLGAANGKEALELMDRYSVDVLITDIQMPVMDGLELISETRKTNPRLPIIVTSAFSDTEYLLSAIDLGVSHYATKPIKPRVLIEKIDSILRSKILQEQIDEQTKIISQMVRLSPNPVFSIKDNSIEFASDSFLELAGVRTLNDLEAQKNSLVKRFRCASHRDERFETLRKWVEHTMSFSGSVHMLKIDLLNRNKTATYKIDTLHNHTQNRSIYVLTNVSDLADDIDKKTSEIESVRAEIIRQQRMYEVQSRLAQMGQMIGAISHQWKQPINVLSIVGDMIEDDLNDYQNGEGELDVLYEHIDSIRSNVRYMNTTMDDFKNFFSPSKVISSFTLKSILESIDTMVGKQYKHGNIEFKHMGDMDVVIYSYPNEFKQALINLFSNSMDAYNEKSIKNGREIEVEAKKVDDYLHLRVEDSAGGIKEENLSRIFDSYFTTKGDKGTGIGLNLVKMIVEDSMGGEMEVSNGKNGARFDIKIPLKREGIL